MLLNKIPPPRRQSEREEEEDRSSDNELLVVSVYIYIYIYIYTPSLFRPVSFYMGNNLTYWQGKFSAVGCCIKLSTNPQAMKLPLPSSPFSLSADILEMQTRCRHWRLPRGNHGTCKNNSPLCPVPFRSTPSIGVRERARGVAGNLLIGFIAALLFDRSNHQVKTNDG